MAAATACRRAGVRLHGYTSGATVSALRKTGQKVSVLARADREGKPQTAICQPKAIASREGAAARQVSGSWSEFFAEQAMALIVNTTEIDSAHRTVAKMHCLI